MKKIALFPSAFHPSLGGVEELTGQLALRLKGLGMGVLICTNRWPRDLCAEEEWNGIPVKRYPFRLPDFGLKSRVSFLLTRGLILNRLLRDLSSFGAELIHVQCISSNAWYALSMSQSMNIPLVVSTQGERTMDASRIFERHPMYNRLMLGVTRRAHFVTACSESARQDMEAYCSLSVGGPVTRLIYNGVDSDLFDDVVPWKPDRPFVFAMGRLVPQKGFRELIAAFSRIRISEIDLLLAGDGPDKEALVRLSNDLGLAERVKFLGRADRKMVATLFSGSLGFVVPSLREPMGIVALEAMAAGKALLVSAVGGLKEVAPPGRWCRHHSPGNITELAEGLEWLASNGTQEPLECHRRYARGFTWDRITQQYTDLYAQCA